MHLCLLDRRWFVRICYACPTRALIQDVSFPVVLETAAEKAEDGLDEAVLTVGESEDIILVSRSTGIASTTAAYLIIYAVIRTSYTMNTEKCGDYFSTICSHDVYPKPEARDSPPKDSLWLICFSQCVTTLRRRQVRCLRILGNFVFEESRWSGDIFSIWPNSRLWYFRMDDTLDIEVYIVQAVARAGRRNSPRP
ncbi:hypothetical protein B0O99DRAFT_355580 [Bisporella sp. PMI_857]|nr:hypothetical protein B0O99DRAFT_355580 [Bisporella sp. PMI_857]